MSETTVIAPQMSESSQSSNTHKNGFRGLRGLRVKWKSSKNREVQSDQSEMYQPAPSEYTTTIPIHSSQSNIDDYEIYEDSSFRYPKSNECIEKQFSRVYEPGTNTLLFTYQASRTGSVTESQIREAESELIESFAGGDPETRIAIQIDDSESESELENYFSMFGMNPLVQSGSYVSSHPNTDYQRFGSWLKEEEGMNIDEFDDSYEEFLQWRKWKKTLVTPSLNNKM